MKEPKPKEVECRWCHKTFEAEPYECWAYNENGDDKFEGYQYHTTCPECEVEPGTKEHYQRLYDSGLLSREELDKELEDLK